MGWLTTRKIASKFNPYLKKSNDSIFFKSNFLRLHALPDTDKLILRLNDELLSHVHQMSAIKRFFLFNLNWMNNCLKTTDSFLLTHSEDSQQRQGDNDLWFSVLKLSAGNAWQQTKIQHFIFKWFFLPRKYVRWKSHKFNFRNTFKSQICVHLKKNTETHDNQIIKHQKDLKNKYDNVHFYYVLQTFDQITTGTSKSFKTAKACTNPRKIVATKKEVQRARP